MTTRIEKNNARARRGRVEAAKVARRLAIERQFARTKDRPKGLFPLYLEPPKTVRVSVAARWTEHKSVAGIVYRKPLLPPGTPGFFKRGALSGVVYQSHIRRAYV